MELNLTLYKHLIQTNIAKNLPNSFVEYIGGPLFTSIAELLPFKMNSSVKYADMEFKAPWGFASGWADSYKKMEVISSLGAGAVVSKTITYKSKPGNPFPRFFRWKDHIINSMGLPNPGLHWWMKELKKHQSIPEHFIFSIKGNDKQEWRALVRGVGQFTNVLELNFSCPNVEAGIIDIPTTISLLRDIRQNAKNKKLFLKISPEYSISAVIDLIQQTKESNIIDGVTCFNTYPVHYKYLGNPLKIGGISGVPLQHKLFATVSEIRKKYSSSSELPIFGLGGVWTVLDALRLYKSFDVFPFVLSAFLIQGPFLFRNWYKSLDKFR